MSDVQTRVFYGDRCVMVFAKINHFCTWEQASGDDDLVCEWPILAEQCQRELKLRMETFALSGLPFTSKEFRQWGI